MDANGEYVLNMMQWISLIASIASLVLAVIAIALSIVFYVLSNKSNKEISETAKTINEQTDVLNKLFNTMLNTSFDMIRENNAAMQNYIFSSVGKNNDNTEDTDESKI